MKFKNSLMPSRYKDIVTVVVDYAAKYLQEHLQTSDEAQMFDSKYMECQLYSYGKVINDTFTTNGLS